MSNFKGHSNAGAVAALAAGGIGLVTFTLPQALAGALATYCFALFPDLDTKSTPSKIFYILIIGVLSLLFFQGFYKQATVVAIFAVIPQILNHRGFLHSFMASLLIPLGLLALFALGIAPFRLAIFLTLCGVLGYWTHLLLDKF